MAILGNRKHCCSSNLLIDFGAVSKNVSIIFGVLMLFPEELVYGFQGLCFLFFSFVFGQRQTNVVFRLIPRRWVWRTLWCHHPHPSQSLNLQTVVEIDGQETESDVIFQKVLSVVIQKHNYKLDCWDSFCLFVFLALRNSSWTFSCVYLCSKTSLALLHADLLQEKYEKFPEQFANLGGR